MDPIQPEIIKIIARTTSLLNKLTGSKAVCNIHEQFSVCLWQYNADDCYIYIQIFAHASAIYTRPFSLRAH